MRMCIGQAPIARPDRLFCQTYVPVTSNRAIIRQATPARQNTLHNHVFWLQIGTVAATSDLQHLCPGVQYLNPAAAYHQQHTPKAIQARTWLAEMVAQADDMFTCK
jgi:hypothetical protein